MKYFTQPRFTDQSLWKWMKISRYRRKALVSKWGNLIGRISAPFEWAVKLLTELECFQGSLSGIVFICLFFISPDKQWFVKIDPSDYLCLSLFPISEHVCEMSRIVRRSAGEQNLESGETPGILHEIRQCQRRSIHRRLSDYVLSWNSTSR